MFDWRQVPLASVPSLPARLGWKFLCAPAGDDVAMEVQSADTGEVLLKVERTAASEGVLDLLTAGRLLLRFDNSHSYWNAKTVGFAVTFSDPSIQINTSC